MSSSKTDTNKQFIELRASTLRKAVHYALSVQRVVSAAKTGSGSEIFPTGTHSIHQVLDSAILRANRHLAELRASEEKNKSANETNETNEPTPRYLAFGALMPITPCLEPSYHGDSLKSKTHYLFYGRPFDESNAESPVGIADFASVPTVDFATDKPVEKFEPLSAHRAAKLWILPHIVVTNHLVNLLPAGKPGSHPNLDAGFLCESDILHAEDLAAFEVKSPEFLETLIHRDWDSMYWPEAFIHKNPDATQEEFAVAVFLPSLMQMCALCFELTREQVQQENNGDRDYFQDEFGKNLSALTYLYDTKGQQGYEYLGPSRRDRFLELDAFEPKANKAAWVLFKTMNDALERAGMSVACLLNVLCLRRKSKASQLFTVRGETDQPLQKINLLQVDWRASFGITKPQLSAFNVSYDLDTGVAFYEEQQTPFGVESHPIKDKPLHPIPVFEDKTQAQKELDDLTLLQGANPGLSIKPVGLTTHDKLFRVFEDTNNELVTLLKVRPDNGIQ